MSASDYQVSFPYGATSAPYSASRPHRGDDRPCPEGTPVVINSQQIGLTGNTGLSTGPHLHIQEWSGGYATTRKPQNAFQPGTVVNIDPNGTQGDGSFGKFITIQTPDGWNDTYCHLSEINVQVGQEIDMEPFNEGDRVNWNRTTYGGDRDWHKDQVGKPYKEAIYNIQQSSDYINETRVNAGDEVNINNVISGVGAQVKGKLWKDATTVYILPKYTSEYEEVPFKVYKKKG